MQWIEVSVEMIGNRPNRSFITIQYKGRKLLLSINWIAYIITLRSNRTDRSVLLLNFHEISKEDLYRISCKHLVNSTTKAAYQTKVAKMFCTKIVNSLRKAKRKLIIVISNQNFVNPRRRIWQIGNFYMRVIGIYLYMRRNIIKGY